MQHTLLNPPWVPGNARQTADYTRSLRLDPPGPSHWPRSNRWSGFSRARLFVF